MTILHINLPMHRQRMTRFWSFSDLIGSVGVTYNPEARVVIARGFFQSSISWLQLKCTAHKAYLCSQSATERQRSVEVKDQKSESAGAHCSVPTTQDCMASVVIDQHLVWHTFSQPVKQPSHLSGNDQTSTQAGEQKGKCQSWSYCFSDGGDTGQNDKFCNMVTASTEAALLYLHQMGPQWRRRLLQKDSLHRTLLTESDSVKSRRLQTESFKLKQYCSKTFWRWNWKRCCCFDHQLLSHP